MNIKDEIPDRQLWSRASADGLKPAEFGTYTTPLIRKSDSVGSVGTLLAARLMAILRDATFGVVGAEQPHPALAAIPPEAEDYRSFSATYGEIWTARALRQLVRRADRSFTPKEDRWHIGDAVIDPYRPGLVYQARTDQEFDLLLDRHLNAVRSAFRRCSTLLVALGGSEVCEAVVDGAVVSAWYDLSSDSLDPERHAFRTLTVAETIADLNDAIDGLRALNPGISIILMISPEPPAATAAASHIVAASAHGKAILRVAMEEVAKRPGVEYFPALEIAATIGAGDGRTVTTPVVEAIAAALLEACEGGSIEMVVAKEVPSIEAEAESPAEETAPAAEVPEAAAQDPKPPRKRKQHADASGAVRGPVVPTVVDMYSTANAPVPRKQRKAPKEPRARKARPAAVAIVAKAKPAEDTAKAKLRQERADRRTAREANKVHQPVASPAEAVARKTRKAAPAPKKAAVNTAELLAARVQKHKEILEAREKRRAEFEAKQAANREKRAAVVAAEPAAAKPARKTRAKPDAPVAVEPESTEKPKTPRRKRASTPDTPA